MTAIYYLSLLNALICVGLAIFVFSRNPKLLVNRSFALGMVALAFEEFGHYKILAFQEPHEALFWFKLLILGHIGGGPIWLLFSLIFARSNSREILLKWRISLILVTIVSTVFMVVLATGALFREVFFTSDQILGFPLNNWDYSFYIFRLIVLVMILINLENTFRASFGPKRWQIKYFFLGLGALFAFWIYLISQHLLFSFVDTKVFIINSAVLLILLGLITFTLVWRRILDVDVFVSRYVVYNSLTIFLVGGYLILVGFVAKVIYNLGENWFVFLGTFFFFLAVLALAAVLLSDKLRLKVKTFINRHFYANQYDYRIKWLELTEALSSKLSYEEVTGPLLDFLVRTIAVNRATLWLHDLGAREYRVVKALDISLERIRTIRISDESTLVRTLAEQDQPWVVRPISDREEVLFKEALDLITQTGASVIVPLCATGQLVGLVTLGPKITDDPFYPEDLDFLKVIAKQAASVLLNARLSQELVIAKESEAFHTVSTFFIHDLKNFVAMLSLVIQNAEVHSGNPDFRKDAFQTITETVRKMQQLIKRLTNLSKGIELRLEQGDINTTVRDTVKKFDGSLKTPIELVLREVPRISYDPLQMEMVLANLLLNAEEASQGKGRISIQTYPAQGGMKLEVDDQGTGISKEFMGHALFKPFKTTKSSGAGIGLFQCKQIVEAHGGRIEVTSQVGKGSTFTVVLPVDRA